MIPISLPWIDELFSWPGSHVLERHLRANVPQNVVQSLLQSNGPTATDINFASACGIVLTTQTVSTAVQLGRHCCTFNCRNISVFLDDIRERRDCTDISWLVLS